MPVLLVPLLLILIIIIIVIMGARVPHLQHGPALDGRALRELIVQGDLRETDVPGGFELEGLAWDDLECAVISPRRRPKHAFTKRVGQSAKFVRRK